MHFVLLSTNFLESVIDSKIEYLIVLPMSYLPVQLSTVLILEIAWESVPSELLEWKKSPYKMYERNPHTKCMRDPRPILYERNHHHTKCMRDPRPMYFVWEPSDLPILIYYPYKVYVRSEAHMFCKGCRAPECHVFCMEAHVFCMMESGSKSGKFCGLGWHR